MIFLGIRGVNVVFFYWGNFGLGIMGLGRFLVLMEYGGYMLLWFIDWGFLWFIGGMVVFGRLNYSEVRLWSFIWSSLFLIVVFFGNMWFFDFFFCY